MYIVSNPGRGVVLPEIVSAPVSSARLDEKSWNSMTSLPGDKVPLTGTRLQPSPSSA